MFKFFIAPILFIICLHQSSISQKSLLIINEGDIDISHHLETIISQENNASNNEIYNSVISDTRIKRRNLIDQKILSMLDELSGGRIYLDEKKLDSIYQELYNLTAIDLILIYDLNLKSNLFSYSIVDIEKINLKKVNSYIRKNEFISSDDYFARQLFLPVNENYLTLISSDILVALFNTPVLVSGVNGNSISRNDTIFTLSDKEVLLQLKFKYNLNNNFSSFEYCGTVYRNQGNKISFPLNLDCDILIYRYRNIFGDHEKRIRLIGVKSNLVENSSRKFPDFGKLYLQNYFLNQSDEKIPIYNTNFSSPENIDFDKISFKIKSTKDYTKKDFIESKLVYNWDEFQEIQYINNSKLDFSLVQSDSLFPICLEMPMPIKQSLDNYSCQLILSDKYNVVKDSMEFPLKIVPLSPWHSNMGISFFYYDQYVDDRGIRNLNSLGIFELGIGLKLNRFINLNAHTALKILPTRLDGSLYEEHTLLKIFPLKIGANFSYPFDRYNTGALTIDNSFNLVRQIKYNFNDVISDERLALMYLGIGFDVSIFTIFRCKITYGIYTEIKPNSIFRDNYFGANLIFSYTMPKYSREDKIMKKIKDNILDYKRI